MFSFWLPIDLLTPLLRQFIGMLLECSLTNPYTVPRLTLELAPAGPVTVFVNDPLSIYTPLK
jgi:hypothetical protein